MKVEYRVGNFALPVIRSRDFVMEPIGNFRLKPGRQYLIRRFKSYSERNVVGYNVKQLNSFGCINKPTTITHVSEI